MHHAFENLKRTASENGFYSTAAIPVSRVCCHHRTANVQLVMTILDWRLSHRILERNAKPSMSDKQRAIRIISEFKRETISTPVVPSLATAPVNADASSLRQAARYHFC